MLKHCHKQTKACLQYELAVAQENTRLAAKEITRLRRILHAAKKEKKKDMKKNDTDVLD